MPIKLLLNKLRAMPIGTLFIACLLMLAACSEEYAPAAIGALAARGPQLPANPALGALYNRSCRSCHANDAASVLRLKAIRDYLGWSDTLRGLPIKALVDGIEKEIAVQASWLNYTSERNVRFNEMEYHLPRENGLAALREVRGVLEQAHKEVFFPLEVRAEEFRAMYPRWQDFVAVRQQLDPQGKFLNVYLHKLFGRS